MNKVLNLLIKKYSSLFDDNDLFRLRLVSKIIKKFANKSLKNHPESQVKLRCAKNSILIESYANFPIIPKQISNLAQRTYSQVKSLKFINKHKYNYDQLFSSYDHILTIENHKFNLFYSDFNVIKLRTDITKVSDWEHGIEYICTFATQLELFLYGHHRVNIISLDDGKQTFNKTFICEFYVKFQKKFLSRCGRNKLTDNKFECVLFWWYRKFHQMPPNGTRLRYLKLNNTQDYILSIVRCLVENDCLIRYDEKRQKLTDRNNWVNDQFNDIPLFIDDNND